ncbi:hypothetical protein BGZ60DRAFT_523290 [Tricladium varicosporioides]|nr:hypothetical protein BGZ60DRAFT_523290 [Hymenoscyphus varicosporioides]
MSASEYTIDAMEEPINNEQIRYVNDDLDDVFGSAPSSPSFENNGGTNNRNNGNAEVSDVPRLKEKHEKEGYRDGVTNGKAQTVQVGFDEGYGLGAVLGLKIGKILGLLEGICNALGVGMKSHEGEIFVGEKERLDKLFAMARSELKTQSVFGRDWWGEDGIWKFEVPGEGVEGKEVTFLDVASAHPLVVKWDRIIEDEVAKWRLDLRIMEQQEPANIEHATPVEQADRVSPAGAQKEQFSW